METNPNPYDSTHYYNQMYHNKPMAQNEHQLMQVRDQKMPQRNVGQKPGTQLKMPKARALALANTLKRALATASIIGFGMFGGLVAMHQVSTTSTSTTQSTQSTSGSSNTSSNSTSSSQDSNNFFKQQGGNTSGSSSSTSSSNTTSGSSSAPVTGTTTS